MRNLKIIDIYSNGFEYMDEESLQEISTKTTKSIRAPSGGTTEESAPSEPKSIDSN